MLYFIMPNLHTPKQTIMTPHKYLTVLKIMGPPVHVTVITGHPTSTVTLQDKNVVSYNAENGCPFFGVSPLVGTWQVTSALFYDL